MTGTAFELIQYLTAQAMEDPSRQFDLEEHREKRTLTQNAYYWALLGKLANVLRMPRSEIHENMLREYAPSDVFTVLDEVPVSEYYEHFDVIRPGWLNGKLYKHIRVFRGSSKMNSKEFGVLLDGMIQECDQQGIETMTPEQARALKFTEPKG